LHFSNISVISTLSNTPNFTFKKQITKTKMKKPHFSRHFLSSRATALATIQFAPAGEADDHGVAVTHNLLAIAGWSEDAGGKPFFFLFYILQQQNLTPDKTPKNRTPAHLG
jgi:hypothetical protein